MKLKNYRERRSTNRSAWYHNAPSIEEQTFEWEEFYNGTGISFLLRTILKYNIFSSFVVCSLLQSTCQLLIVAISLGISIRVKALRIKK